MKPGQELTSTDRIFSLESLVFYSVLAFLSFKLLILSLSKLPPTNYFILGLEMILSLFVGIFFGISIYYLGKSMLIPIKNGLNKLDIYWPKLVKFIKEKLSIISSIFYYLIVLVIALIYYENSYQYWFILIGAIYSGIKK